MSYVALRWWVDLRGPTKTELTTAERLVMMYFAFRAGKGGCTWPSLQTIADDTGIDVRTASRCVAALCEAKLLDKVNSHRGRTSCYRLPVVQIRDAQAHRQAKERGHRPGEQPYDSEAAFYGEPDRRERTPDNWSTPPLAACQTVSTRGNNQDVESIAHRADERTTNATDGSQLSLLTTMPTQPQPAQTPASQLKKKLEIGDTRFAEFWRRYPRRVGRGAAERAYLSAVRNGASEARILRGLETAEFRLDEPEYIPHPSTWLNGKRWLDEPTPQPVYYSGVNGAL